MTNLTDTQCAPCAGLEGALSVDSASNLKTTLHEDWDMAEDGKSITRRFTFKGFAKATYMANLAAFLGDKEGHHPDICFGWGYCQVTYTSHEAGGLTQNDFICAAKLDAAVA